MFPFSSLFRRFEHKFDFRWPTTGEEMSIEWVFDKGDLFFRPSDADTSILWHALDKFGKRAPEVVLDEALKVKQLRRALPLSEREFAFWNQKEGIYAVQGSDVGAVFSLPKFTLVRGDRRFFWSPCKEIVAYLHSTEIPPTDFQKARLFLAKQGVEEWASIELEQSSTAHLKNVLRAIVTLYGPMVETLERFSISFDWDGNLTLQHHDKVPPLLMELVNRWFLPTQKQRRRVRGFSSWNVGFEEHPSILGEPPSAHERLEVVLFLRDFLRDKLPEEEIARLLHV